MHGNNSGSLNSTYFREASVNVICTNYTKMYFMQAAYVLTAVGEAVSSYLIR